MSRFWLSLAFFVFSSHPSNAQWESVSPVDSVHQVSKHEATIHAGLHAVRITFLSEDLVRVRLIRSTAPAKENICAIEKADWTPPNVTAVETSTQFSLKSDRVCLIVNKSPFRLSFRDSDGRIINEDDSLGGIFWSDQKVRLSKRMPAQEYYYGFGEKTGRLERRGTSMTMWNSDIPAYTSETDPLYISVPFFYGMNEGKAYGIFFNNSHRTTFDMGRKSNTSYTITADGGEIDYYFFAGPTPKAILSRFTELTGRMPLPPRWSLGYQQCKWSYFPEARVREIARGFRDRNIPCDVIYLDIDYMDGYRIFTWNNFNFPDPAKMIADLRRDGFRTAVIVDPGIKVDTAYHAFRSGLAADAFLKYPNGNVFVGKVWPGECAFPDFSNTRSRDWWGNSFRDLVHVGIRGWWNDMNEPSVFDVPTKTIDLDVIHKTDIGKGTHAQHHNLYGLQMTKATFDGVKRLLSTERPFVLTRATFASGQRYSAVWTGDNVASWKHLRMAIPMSLNLSISGFAFVGSDIGGFIGYPSGELFARWLQLGVFSPLMRAHSVINEKNKEPWEYGDEFRHINRETIELRYRLLPYIYNTIYESSVTGMPAMRPLFFEYPDDSRYVRNETEFLFGKNLLIAPVLHEGESRRTLSLPEGMWFDFWSGTILNGSTDIEVEVLLSRIPIFAKAGSIIPTQQVVQHVDEEPIDPLTLLIFPMEGTFSSSYYEDDGLSFEYEDGKFFKRTFTCTSTISTTQLLASLPVGGYRPKPRDLVVMFFGWKNPPVSVTLDKKFVDRTESLDQCTVGWTFDPERNAVSVKFPDLYLEREVLLTK